MRNNCRGKVFKNNLESGWLPKHPEKPWLVDDYLADLNKVFKTFQISDSKIANFKNISERR